MQQPYWILGIILITIVNTSLNLAAYAFAAQSLLAAVGSLALLWNLIVTKFFLDEKPSTYDYVGTGISMIGVTVATVFGAHTTKDYDIDTLIELYTRTLFIIFIVCDILFIFALFFASKRSDFPFRRLASAALPGVIAGLTALFSKSAVEILKSASTGGKDFQHPVTYLIIVAAIAFAVTQLKFLNRTLRMYNPLVAIPIYNAFMLLFGALSGIIYFEEFKDLGPLDYFLFPLGVAIMLGALILFAKRPIQLESDPIDSMVSDVSCVTLPGDPNVDSSQSEVYPSLSFDSHLRPSCCSSVDSLLSSDDYSDKIDI